MNGDMNYRIDQRREAVIAADLASRRGGPDAIS